MAFGGFASHQYRICHFGTMLIINRKLCSVIFHMSNGTFSNYETPFVPVTVPIDEIVSVAKITGRKDEGGFEVVGFTVCYIEHLKKFQLRRAMTQFLSSPDEGEEWSSRIQEAIEKGLFTILKAAKTNYLNPI